MKSDEFFARHPVFTRTEFAASCGTARTPTSRAPDRLLSYHTRQGNLLRVKQGLYVVVPPGMSPSSAPVDAYLLASRMAEDAVLAYHTAFELHGVAYSSTERLLFLSEHRLLPVTFRSLRFRAVPVPDALKTGGFADVGITVVDRAGLDVRVTTLERTLVDVLNRPILGGGWEEIWRSLEAVSYFDVAEVIEYALRLDNATAVAKVGFFLEQHRDSLSVDEAQLQQLRIHAPTKPHYIRRSSRTPGVLVRDWNLIVPRSVIERSWEEFV